MADAGLVAADAGADVVEAPGGRLVGHLGIADHGPGHAAKVGLAAGHDLLGDARIIDAPGADQRPADPGLEGRRIGCRVADLIEHRRHDVERAGDGRGGAGDDAEIINNSVAVQGHQGVCDLVVAQPLVAEIVG